MNNDWQSDDFITAYNNFTCEYNPEQIELAYYFWKLSRKVLVVDLPCWSEYDTPRQYMDAIRERLFFTGVSTNE